MMKLLTSNPTRKGEESGYETDSKKEMEYDSDSDKEMKRNSDSDKKMEHNSNSNKEMEHNPNSDAIFKTKEPHLIGLKDTTTIVKEYKPCCFRPHTLKKSSGIYGLRNTASIYQHFTQDKMDSARKILLGGAQEGMIMTVTPQDCVVHWPGSFTSEEAQSSKYIEELHIKRGKNSDPAQKQPTAQPNEG